MLFVSKKAPSGPSTSTHSREWNGELTARSCIDCLDRTNVVQSALARHVLSQMLTQLGLIVDPNTSAVESVFNDGQLVYYICDWD